jgi:predicted lipoprotein with Yx(FWY)xxD motif
MKSLLKLATLAGALALAACDSGGSDSSTEASHAGDSTVSTMHINGIGNVLTDAAGKTLYTPDQEANGQVLCIDACTTFWVPLVASAGFPSDTEAVTNLGVINRPDGTAQVTEAGKPLYTFSQDSPGDIKGNGFTDDFAGQHFTWRAVLAEGTTASSTGTTGTTPSGY